MPRKRATIREVAQATGLSPAAVSYALRGLQVSPETMRRVRDAAAELGYEADPIARALASGKTGTIGLLAGSLEDLWQQALATGISRTLLAHDRYVLIADAAGDPARQHALAQRLRDQRVDAMIVQPIDPAAEFWAAIGEAVPVVAIGDSLPGTAAEVVFDNRQGVTLALEHLLDLGHRRLALLTPTMPSTPDRPADAHVLAEGERLGLEIDVRTAPQDLPGATAVARKTLESGASAVFCLADSIAYGVYAAATALGKRIPDDISVMGYDNHPVSALLTPGLTTVDWDIDSIVRAAVRLVVAAADGATRRRRSIQQPTLIDRGSVRAR